MSHQENSSDPSRMFLLQLLALALLSVFLTFYNLGKGSLRNGDEARYAVASREMLLEGDWITPKLDGKTYFRKPPLRFWLNAASFYLFGYSEWVVRFWSAAAAFGTVIFTALIGKRLFGPAAGLWAGLALTTGAQFLYGHCARTGEMDSQVLFFLTSSLFFLLTSEENEKYLILSLGLMGLSSITKNLAGLLPLGIAILYLLMTGKWRKYRPSVLAVSLVLFLLITFSWILAMVQVHGEIFWNNYVVRQVYSRAFSTTFTVGEPGATSWSGGLFFIGKALLNGLFPWSLLMIPAVVLAFLRIPLRNSGQQLLPLLWFCGVFLGLVFFRNKLYWYVLPLYPAACILIGAYLNETFREEFSWRSCVPAILIIPGIFLLNPDPTFNPFIGRSGEPGVDTLIVNPNILLALLFAFLSVGVWLTIARKSFRLATRLIAILLIGYSIYFASLPLRYSSRQSDIHELAIAISKEAVGPRNTVFFCNIPRASIHGKEQLWGRPILAMWYFTTIPRTKMSFVYKNESALQNLLKEGGNKIFVLPAKDYASIKSKYAHRWKGNYTVNGRDYALIRPAG